MVKPLPSAQVRIPGSWDGALCQAPCSAGSLLLPLLFPWLVCGLLCQINDQILKKDVIYLFEGESAKWGRGGAEGVGGAGSLLSREPDAGLDPRTLRS